MKSVTATAIMTGHDLPRWLAPNGAERLIEAKLLVFRTTMPLARTGDDAFDHLKFGLNITLLRGGCLFGRLGLWDSRECELWNRGTDRPEEELPADERPNHKSHSTCIRQISH